MRRDRLLSGDTRSCGCLASEAARRNAVKHGCAAKGDTLPEYWVWHAMKKRCTNSSDAQYKNYGGRGIKICSRWGRFENFIADMGQRPSPKHTLERNNNSLGYCKSNCRWATFEEQANNRRSNRLLTLEGRTQTIAQWARELGIGRNTLRYRVDAGFTETEILAARGGT